MHLHTAVMTRNRLQLNALEYYEFKTIVTYYE